jgi:hypothetical protein
MNFMHDVIHLLILFEMMSKLNKNNFRKNFTICFPSSTRQFMGFDLAYFPYKQQSDFYYLTCCMQPDAILLLHGDDQTFSTNLFF